MPFDAAAQLRGDRGDYARYLAGMDASMRQKVALTAAHLPTRGRVADMGMGSGTGSHALASLYPGLQVIGVDLADTSIAMARERYQLPNLRFAKGDIAQRCFDPGSLDGILDSSVLHHVTSFTGYDHAAAARALAAQVEQLAPHGVLLVRDFVAPATDEPPPNGDVHLDLPADDGDEGRDPRTCSTAALFERFAAEFRPLIASPQKPGFLFVELASPARGRKRYRVSHRMAVEFLLRKDYRADWDAEVKEEYTYFDQSRFEAEMRGLGLRVLVSSPIRNPWIYRNRLIGKVAIHAPDGRAIELPPTNYVIAGEKVVPGEGVEMRPAGGRPPIGFLKLEHFEHVATGQVFDLVRRPHLTVDVLPWFEDDGDLFLLARCSYPRPILSALGTPCLDGSRSPHYHAEVLHAIQADKPLGQTVEESLLAIANLGAERLKRFEQGARYFPSPGGLQEEVQSVLVEIEPTFEAIRCASGSGFSTSGVVKALEAQQCLRAAQVGGLAHARLEMAAYDLLARRGRDPGPWIGETITLREANAAPTHWASLFGIAAPRRKFRPVRPEKSAGYLRLLCSQFEELDGAGRVVASRPLEYVMPAQASRSTAVVAPLLRIGQTVLLGIEDDDLPAAQAFVGNSQLYKAPAWRLPNSVVNIPSATQWLRAELESAHGIVSGEFWELGGRYYPSAGSTPEVVHVFAAEVLNCRTARQPLLWTPLSEAVSALASIQDGHLRIAALRAAHALGVLTEMMLRKDSRP
ncbi:MAG: methyltransferase domain-containing protein [Planctomycetes bacterium]|nr:methyltransferase domain-containing protein [Planctomycetota bacterium]